MDDLISRQAAIDLWEHYHPYIATQAMEYDEALKALPSAQPQTKYIPKITLNKEQVQDVIEKAKCEILAVLPRWIPCSERPPEKEGNYFVTDEAAGMAETLIDKYIRCDDGEWVWMYSQNVTAWMKLPVPYSMKEEQDG